MGKSYTYTWEGHYQEKDDREKKQYHLVYGMTISEMIKKLINIYRGDVTQFSVIIWHQTNPIGNSVRQLKILKNFHWNKDLFYIHDIYKGMGLDYNKPIPRKYYELKDYNLTTAI